MRGSGYCFSGCRAARSWEATKTEIFLAAPRDFSAKREPCAKRKLQSRQPFLASHAILTNECGTGTRDQPPLATQATEMSESEGLNLNPYGEPPLIS